MRWTLGILQEVDWHWWNVVCLQSKYKETETLMAPGQPISEYCPFKCEGVSYQVSVPCKCHWRAVTRVYKSEADVLVTSEPARLFWLNSCCSCGRNCLSRLPVPVAFCCLSYCFLFSGPLPSWLLALISSPNFGCLSPSLCVGGCKIPGLSALPFPQLNPVSNPLLLGFGLDLTPNYE